MSNFRTSLKYSGIDVKAVNRNHALAVCATNTANSAGLVSAFVHGNGGR